MKNECFFFYFLLQKQKTEQVFIYSCWTGSLPWLSWQLVAPKYQALCSVALVSLQISALRMTLQANAEETVCAERNRSERNQVPPEEHQQTLRTRFHLKQFVCSQVLTFVVTLNNLTVNLQTSYCYAPFTQSGSVQLCKKAFSVQH